MKENKLMLLCILILSVSIIFGSVYIGNAINSKNVNKVDVADIPVYNKALMTDKEAAEYLNLQLDAFDKLVIMYELQRKEAINGYDTFAYIPFIKVDGVRLFNKAHLDKWIEYNSLNSQEIEIK